MTHSFPTRRSSDLGEPAPAVEKRLRVRPADGRAAEGRERDGGQKRQEQDAADREDGTAIAQYPVVEGRFGGKEARALPPAGDQCGDRKSTVEGTRGELHVARGGRGK